MKFIDWTCKFAVLMLRKTPQVKIESPLPRPVYRMDDLVLDVDLHSLKRGAEPIPLPRLSFQLLFLLARYAPDMVSYEEIQSEIWQNVIVSPETISQRVKLLRDGLGDNASQPRYIRVIRGEGLQLIPECIAEYTVPPGISKSRRASALLMTAAGSCLALLVAWQFFLGGITSPTAPSTTSGVITELLVEPFETQGGGSGNWVYSYLLRTMSSHSLSMLPGLAVSRTAISGVGSLVPPDNPLVGKNDRHSAKLLGSIRVEGNQLIIDASLEAGHPAREIWFREYSGPSAGFLGLFQTFLADVTDNLRPGMEAELAKWIREQPTGSPVAFNHFLQASRSFRPEDMIHFANLAIEADSEFAEAYALRAWANGMRLYSHHQKEAIGRADMVIWQEALLADSAIATNLGGDIWRAGFAQALLHTVSWNWTQADPLFLLAVQAEPGDFVAAAVYAHFLVITGRQQRALAILENLVTVFPNNFALLSLHGVIHAINRDFFNARSQFERSLELNEADPMAHRWLGIIMGLLGEREAANRHLARTADLMGEAENTFVFSTLAYAWSEAGNSENAFDMFMRVRDLEEVSGVEVAPASWVMAYLAIDQTDQALEWMRAAVEQSRSGQPDPGFFAAYYLKANLMRDERLETPEWIRLRQQLGYKDPSPIGIN